MIASHKIAALLVASGGVVFLIGASLPQSSPVGNTKPSELVHRIDLESASGPDCGQFALRLVAALRSCPTAPLDQYFESRTIAMKGMDMLDLQEGVQKLGLASRAVHLDYAGLHAHLGSPSSLAILYLDQHFVTAVGARSDGRIVVVDPLVGVSYVNEETLNNSLKWSGRVLLIN